MPPIDGIGYATLDFPTQEAIWKKCRNKEADNDFASCESCSDRFKCWTASEPIDTRARVEKLVEVLRQNSLSTKQAYAVTRMMENALNEEIRKVY